MRARQASDASIDTIHSRQTTHHFYDLPVQYISSTDYNRERTPLALVYGSSQLHFGA